MGGRRGSSWISGAALALCVLLAGCFTSDQPLFNPRQGEALMGPMAVRVTPHEDGDKPDESGVLTWENGAYVDESDKDKTTISFHRLPGTWWWDGWYIGEMRMSADGGYMYELYRKRGDRILVFNVGCSDLTDAEVAAAHLVRTESGQECKATRPGDLAQALNLLAKRKPAKGYWTFAPAKAG